MDLVGSLSYAFPVWGEWFDVIWAPISAFIFYLLFGGKIGRIGAIINFTEEVLPFLDFIPAFTLGYLYKKYSHR